MSGWKLAAALVGAAAGGAAIVLGVGWWSGYFEPSVSTAGREVLARLDALSAGQAIRVSRPGGPSSALTFQVEP